jgi:hypothetical protein
VECISALIAFAARAIATEGWLSAVRTICLIFRKKNSKGLHISQSFAHFFEDCNSCIEAAHLQWST